MDAAFICYALATNNSNLAFISLWALVVAIPACAVTLAIAGVSVSIHSRAQGTPVKKISKSVAFVATACILIAFAALALWGHRQDEQMALKSEASTVEAFVRDDPSVVALIGPPKSSSIVVSTIERSGPLPTRYEVSVDGTTTIYAVVSVQRSGNKRELHVVCNTAIYFGHRESGKDPCAR